MTTCTECGGTMYHSSEMDGSEMTSADFDQPFSQCEDCGHVVEDTLPPCAISMGCLCAGHARGKPADAPCDTTE